MNYRWWMIMNGRRWLCRPNLFFLNWKRVEVFLEWRKGRRKKRFWSDSVSARRPFFSFHAVVDDVDGGHFWFPSMFSLWKVGGWVREQQKENNLESRELAVRESDRKIKLRLSEGKTKEGRTTTTHLGLLSAANWKKVLNTADWIESPMFMCEYGFVVS